MYVVHHCTLYQNGSITNHHTTCDKRIRNNIIIQFKLCVFLITSANDIVG